MRNKMKRSLGCWMGVLVLCGVAQAADDVTPGMITLQYQAQAPDMRAIQKPGGNVRYTLLGSDRTTVLLSATNGVSMESNGVFTVAISDPNLKSKFSGSGADVRYLRLDVLTTNGNYLTGDLLRLVASPYTYFADQLEGASANFEVGGNLSVTGDAQVMELSASSTVLVSGDLICRGKNNTPEPVWIEQNATKNNTLTLGDTTIKGGATFSNDVTVNVTATYHGNVSVAGNAECSGGASISKLPAMFGSLQTVQASGSPPHGRPGFLIVNLMIKDQGKTYAYNKGMTVQIDSTDYKLQAARKEVGGTIHRTQQQVSFSFFVRSESTWQATTEDGVTAEYHWVDLF